MAVSSKLHKILNEAYAYFVYALSTHHHIPIHFTPQKRHFSLRKVYNTLALLT